jgi:hypothetical protein
MKNRILKFMIEHEYIKTNSMINATIQSHGLGGSPVILKKDILFEDSAITPKGTIYIKGCDPENLKEYVVGSAKVHAVNGMDEPTIRRLFPEIA